MSKQSKKIKTISSQHCDRMKKNSCRFKEKSETAVYDIRMKNWCFFLYSKLMLPGLLNLQQNYLNVAQRSC